MKIAKSKANGEKRANKFEFYLKALSQFEEARQLQEREAAFEKAEDITQDMFYLLHRFEEVELPQEINTVFRETLKKAGKLRYEVYPYHLGKDLLVSLPALLQNFRERNPGKKFSFDSLGEPLQLSWRFGKALNTSIYKIVLEAVKNADQHSQAKSIEVRIDVTLLPKKDNVLLTISIRDDGIGFTPPQFYKDYQKLVEAGHFGLAIIRQEVERCEGKLKVSSQANDYTLIEISAEVKLEPEKFPF